MKSIPVKELKRFITESRMKPNPEFQHLDCIRITSTGSACTFQKTNMNVFVSMSCDYESEPYSHLFDEKTLTAFMPLVNGKLEFKSGSKIELVADGTKNAFTPNDIATYPNFPVAQANFDISFSPEDCAVIKQALNYIDPDPGNQNLSAVHILDGKVFSSDRQYIYSNRISVPGSLVLTPEAARVIADSEGCKYSKAGNYHYLSTGDLIYAFISTEAKTPDFNAVMSPIEDDYCEFDKSDLLVFCDLVIANTKANIIVGELAVEKGEAAYCRFSDTYGNDVEHTFGWTGVLNFDKRIQIPTWIKSLKGIPYNTIRLHKCGQHFGLTSPEDEGLKCVFSCVQSL